MRQLVDRRRSATASRNWIRRYARASARSVSPASSTVSSRSMPPAEVLAPVKLWCDTSTSARMRRDHGRGRRRASAASSWPATRSSPATPPRSCRGRASTAPEAYARPGHDPAAARLRQLLADRRTLDGIRRRLRHRLARRAHAALVAANCSRRSIRSAIWPRCLPPLVEAEHELPAIAAPIADELGLPRGVRVSRRRRRQHDGGDRHRQRRARRLTMSLGTSGTLFAYADHPVVDDGGGWAAFCSSTGGWLPLICTMNCTVATETMARAVRLQQPAKAMTLLAATAARCRRPGAAAVLQRRAHAGPAARAAAACTAWICTTSRAATPIARRWKARPTACATATTPCTAAGLQFDRIRLTGGGSQSAVWRQMVADVFESAGRRAGAERRRRVRRRAAGAVGASAAHGGSDASPTLVREHVRMRRRVLGARRDGRACRGLPHALPPLPAPPRCGHAAL